MLLVESTDPRFGIEYAAAAYGVIFVAFFGYLAYLHVGQRALGRRLEELERVASRDQHRGRA